MEDINTTTIVQRCLNELGDDARRNDVIRRLLTRSLTRLQRLCDNLLRKYNRLTQGPVNLTSEELLSTLSERLIKALQKARPATPRQFFGMANQHIRWALTDLVQWLDKQPVMQAVSEVAEPPLSSGEGYVSPTLKRIFEALADLSSEETEVFDLVKIQGLDSSEAADILGVTSKTVQRRLNRALLFLSNRLRDVAPP